jgi:hypothetical protein
MLRLHCFVHVRKKREVAFLLKPQIYSVFFFFSSSFPILLFSKIAKLACRATVEQLDKLIGRKRGEGDVMAALESVCDASRFRTYDFIPPKMVLGCERLLEFEEHIERLFLAKPPLERKAIEEQLCFSELTSACLNVDPTNPQNKDPSVFIDGEAVDTKRVVDEPPKRRSKKATKKTKTEL